MFDDFINIFEIPIPEKDQKKVAQLIQFIGQMSLKGGGKVPLLHILNIAGFDQKKGMRIQKIRGDLVLKSEKGKLEGMFLNIGKAPETAYFSSGYYKMNTGRAGN